MLKKYLYRVSIPGGMWADVAYYTDTPAKNYRVYYCGSDTGARFEYLGNAARALLQLVNEQTRNGVTGHIFEYATRDEIPRRGSNAQNVKGMYYLMSSAADGLQISADMTAHRVPHNAHRVSSRQIFITVAGDISADALQLINKYNFRRAAK